MSRSFYVLYVKGVRTRATEIVTWCSLLFMVGFWSWYLIYDGPGGENGVRTE
jgi:hypothetical protein